MLVDSQALALANDEPVVQIEHGKSLFFNLQVYPPHPMFNLSGGPKAHKYSQTRPERE